LLIFNEFCIFAIQSTLKNMKKIYVAGAFSDDNVLGVLKNIGRGQEFASLLFKEGFAPFVPWFDKEFVIHRWNEEMKVENFYNYSMEWLKSSDAVFVVPNFTGLKNWEDSVGTVAEIKTAEDNNIPVFYNINDLKIWDHEQK